MVSVGDACPDFSLPDDRGKTITSSDLKGRAFVLYFYPKDDTSGCTLEAIDFSKLKADFEALDVPVLGVSPDSIATHEKFRAKHDLSIGLLADESKILLEAFGVWTEKSMYGRKYMGVERTTALIDADGRIARLWPKVKVSGHASEVLEAARGLAGRADA